MVDRTICRSTPVDIWYVDATALPSDSLDGLSSSLTGEERLAAQRYEDPALRRSYIARRAMRRAVLDRCCDSTTEVLCIAPDRGGKPRIAAPRAARAVRFNGASSGRYAVVAVTPTAEIGIDIEEIRSDLPIDDMANAYFTDNERAALAALPADRRPAAFFVFWTRKEALLKAVGTGLRRRPEEIDLSTPLMGEFAGWSVTDLALFPGYAGALAASAPAVAIRVRQWRPEMPGLRTSGIQGRATLDV